MHHTAYEIRDLTKHYPKAKTPANDGISLEVYQSEVFGLLGPNGAGKTTLVRQMAGLTRPTSGSIRLFGHDLVKNSHLASRWVAMQPQGFALPYNMEPRALIELTGQLRGMAPSLARHRANELIEQFGLAKHVDKPFINLSGGLRRLVSIACALVGDLPVLIFDEPTNDLDPHARRLVWQTIRETSRRGATVLLVTHNVVEAEQALDRVAIVRAGKILATGTPAELKNRVARQVRVEITLRPDRAEVGTALFTGWEGMHQVGEFQYSLSTPRESMDDALGRLVAHLDVVDDFRIVTPNLEDVYLELTGGERLGD